MGQEPGVDQTALDPDALVVELGAGWEDRQEVLDLERLGRLGKHPVERLPTPFVLGEPHPGLVIALGDPVHVAGDLLQGTSAGQRRPGRSSGLASGRRRGEQRAPAPPCGTTREQPQEHGGERCETSEQGDGLDDLGHACQGTLAPGVTAPHKCGRSGVEPRVERIWSIVAASAKMVRLLRRVAGVRHIFDY